MGPPRMVGKSNAAEAVSFCLASVSRITAAAARDATGITDQGSRATAIYASLDALRRRSGDGVPVLYSRERPRFECRTPGLVDGHGHANAVAGISADTLHGDIGRHGSGAAP